MPRQTGGKTAVQLYEETAWSEVTPPPNTLYQIPYVSMDGGPQVNQVDFPEITGSRIPTKQMDGQKSMPATLTVGLHYDAIGHILMHAVGYPTTTIQGATYTHDFHLGKERGEPQGLGILRVNSDAGIVNPYRLYRGLRCTTLAVNMDVEGGVSFDMGLEGYFGDPWVDVNPFDGVPVVEYSSEPISYCVGLIEIDDQPVGYVGSLAVTLDNQLATDEYPVGNQCFRSDLSRGVPTVTGSLGAYLMTDDTLTEKAENGIPVKIQITYGAIWTDGEMGLRFIFDNSRLILDSEPIDTSSGLSVNFNIAASGPDAFQAHLSNDVPSYSDIYTGP